jgi:hypothetical protein
MSEKMTVKEGLEVKNAQGIITASINMTLGEMKLRDVLLREISRTEELLNALKAQLAEVEADSKDRKKYIVGKYSPDKDSPVE